MEEVDFFKNLKNFEGLIRDLGEDPDRDGLLKTPKRYLKALQYLTGGYQQNDKEVIEQALFDVDYHDMIMVRDIEFYSLCEHHMLPFFGKIHVGYIPKDKIIGLSKIPRLTEVFSRRLQVQERLTHQIAHSLFTNLDAQGVGVVIEAYHMCMMMRGIEKQTSFTMTSSMKGVFKNLETRQEFLNLVRSARQPFA